MEALVSLANILYVATYFTENLLRVRLMTLCAGCCLIAYHACRPEPLLTIIGWNVFFVGLNLAQLVRLWPRTRRGVGQVASPSCTW
jgi:hypothetical protein